MYLSGTAAASSLQSLSMLFCHTTAMFYIVPYHTLPYHTSLSTCQFTPTSHSKDAGALGWLEKIPIILDCPLSSRDDRCVRRAGARISRRPVVGGDVVGQETVTRGHQATELVRLWIITESVMLLIKSMYTYPWLHLWEIGALVESGRSGLCDAGRKYRAAASPIILIRWPAPRPALRWKFQS